MCVYVYTAYVYIWCTSEVVWHSMQTGVRAPGASSVSSAAAAVRVTVSDCAGVVGLSGDAPCQDRSGVSANIEAVGRSPQACKCM